jgi:hypothetical protein
MDAIFEPPWMGLRRASDEGTRQPSLADQKKEPLYRLYLANLELRTQPQNQPRPSQ